MQRRDSIAASVASRGRRMSKFVPSRTALHTGSEDSGPNNRPPTRRFENTYRTDPDPGGEFSPSQVQVVVKDILESNLDSVKTYDAAEASKLSTKIASLVKANVKDLQFPRYKIVVNVLIGENKNQGRQVASRCVWNDKLDNYATAQYANEVLWAVVLVHGIFYE